MHAIVSNGHIVMLTVSVQLSYAVDMQFINLKRRRVPYFEMPL